MKFTVSQEKILSALQKLVGVIERRQTLPILANTLIEVQDSRITLTGTDLEIQMIVSTEVQAEINGAVTVPARKLADICKLLPGDANIVMELKDDKLNVRCGRSRFNLSTLPAEQFPAFSEAEYENEVFVSQARFRQALDKTIFCMAQQDVRYYLNGLMLEMEGNALRTVASDGHRLAFYEDLLDEQLANATQVIIPRKGVLELFRILGDTDDNLSIRFASNAIQIALNDVQFSAKLIDGKFPDFRKVIPKEISTTVVLDREECRLALTRVAILSNEKYRGISLNLAPGLLTLNAHNPEQEVAEEEIEIQYQGDVLNIGFNASYLLDAVNNVDADRVHLSFTDNNNSCLIEDPEKATMKFIVMPMRL